MIDFGYTITAQRVVDLDKNSLKLSEQLLAMESSYALCINCGTCTATCSANSFTNFNLRQLMLSIGRGEVEEVARETSKCMMCGKCLLVCPRGVNTRYVVMAIKQLAHNENTNSPSL